jgi:hypothetical protein
MAATASFGTKERTIVASAMSPPARFVQPSGNTAPITTTVMFTPVFAMVHIKCIVAAELSNRPRETQRFGRQK